MGLDLDSEFLSLLSGDDSRNYYSERTEIFLTWKAENRRIYMREYTKRPESRAARREYERNRRLTQPEFRTKRNEQNRKYKRERRRKDALLKNILVPLLPTLPTSIANKCGLLHGCEGVALPGKLGCEWHELTARPPLLQIFRVGQ